MPYRIAKMSGPRPYKIIRTDIGKVVGTSKTLADAQASIRARYMGEHNPGTMRRRGK